MELNLVNEYGGIKERIRKEIESTEWIWRNYMIEKEWGRLNVREIKKGKLGYLNKKGNEQVIKTRIWGNCK